LDIDTDEEGIRKRADELAKQYARCRRASSLESDAMHDATALLKANVMLSGIQLTFSKSLVFKEAKP